MDGVNGKWIENEQTSAGQTGAKFSGAVNADMNAAAIQTRMDRFHAAQGHGFAAEEINHLYDMLSGDHATIVGGDNAKNGADRLVNGVYIQTKYCKDAASSVAAAFEKGVYRYVNPDGSPMQLEVPADQYGGAVRLMARRIEQGQVPKVKDPAKAGQLVRRGHFTYRQAQNITKFCTVESLAFDAANGAIVSTNAFGITAALTLAQSLWGGDPLDIAIEKAACAGLQVGGISFVNTILTAQLMRTEGIKKMMNALGHTGVRVLGEKTSETAASILKSGANVFGLSAVDHADKLLRGNLLTSVTMLCILSSKDISEAFRGRISGQQLFKNIVTMAGGMGGSTAGAMIGQFVLNLAFPGAGMAPGFVVSIAGSAIGGAVGGTAAHTVVGKFIEDDAVEMVGIIKKAFVKLAQEYVLTRDELDILLDGIQRDLTGKTLLEMFASSDRNAYADKMLRKPIEHLIRGRCRIILPMEEGFIRGIGQLAEDAERNAGIFAHSSLRQTDPVEIGKTITGEELTPYAAKKGLYAAKQMNLAQAQAEICMMKVLSDEKKYARAMENIRQKNSVCQDKRERSEDYRNHIYQERKMLKDGLNELLGGTEEWEQN